MTNGTINVTAENIFPIIKKFLYSDHEIFLREIVSNATDATLKLKALAEFGEADKEESELRIEVKIDKEKKTLHVLDQGIGMTAEEIEKYINQIAFSGAEEFVEKYKDKSDKAQSIIGHFGLGFYSAFMVADRVEIFSKSYKEAPGVYWSCDGSPKFTLRETTDKKEHGTEVILHINQAESKEFIEEQRIRELLDKYCKFMPVPIKFGEREETKKTKDDKEEKIKVDDIINDPTPAWTKKPDKLKEKDYKNFYRTLYPMQFEEPLFWIHLNIDHPFHLTGILYFPRLKNQVEVQKDKIQLYQNQVFVTDNVEGIVPEFLHLLRGVIDSPDIPLNVSRSYLQADAAVKKISGYITRKVADKLESLFKNDREDFEKKWEDSKIIIEYGMLSEDKFLEKAQKFALYPNTDGSYFTFGEFTEKIKSYQEDKEGKLVYLYTSHKEEQYSYIQSAKAKGYEVLLLNSPLAPHLIQKLEGVHKNISFVRVDSDSIDKLIKKEENTLSRLAENEKEDIKKLLEENIDQQKFTLVLENLDSHEAPFIITIPEFMRRMKEISQTGGSMFGMSQLPEVYHLIVNTNHELIRKILDQENREYKKQMINNALELAMLSKNLLHGETLSRFVSRSFEQMIS
ncbi:molecular chaperone HtpG [Bacteroidetes bacterium endosymbiont of Geopemphigus sp.]|uniref:molecular chaperone HtpG n=1 Tax=Bacteroidetes bacterium endosymbiont of Geopemphigus sp. TaxID=2047937 RepID=UPI000CD122BC|nr:molecular chaperone HtpG [Bacteroidetes bacterium endosymbiont of Geopemphigus sp.]